MSAESWPVWTVPVIGSVCTDCAAAAHNLCENYTYRRPVGPREKTGMNQTEGQVGRIRDKVCSKEVNSEVHIYG